MNLTGVVSALVEAVALKDERNAPLVLAQQLAAAHVTFC